MKEITKEELDRALAARRERVLAEAEAKWIRKVEAGLARMKKKRTGFWKVPFRKGVEK